MATEVNCCWICGCRSELFYEHVVVKSNATIRVLQVVLLIEWFPIVVILIVVLLAVKIELVVRDRISDRVSD